MKARRLRSLLQRELGYEVDPASERGGSHTWLVSAGRPRVRLAFHDGDEVGGDVVRKVLVRDVGLTLDEAREVVRRG